MTTKRNALSIINSWRQLTPRAKRIFAILAFFLLSIIVTVAGVLAPMSFGDAQSLSQGLAETRQEIDSMDLVHSTVAIFENNFLISLVMFVPFVGPFFGFYVLHNTGLVISAVSQTSSPPVPGLLTFFLLWFYPFTWMEFIAYATAIAESVWLAWRIIQRKGLRELKMTGILIGSVAIILLAAALIEAALIIYFNSLI